MQLSVNCGVVDTADDDDDDPIAIRLTVDELCAAIRAFRAHGALRRVLVHCAHYWRRLGKQRPLTTNRAGEIRTRFAQALGGDDWRVAYEAPGWCHVWNMAKNNSAMRMVVQADAVILTRTELTPHQ